MFFTYMIGFIKLLVKFVVVNWMVEGKVNSTYIARNGKFDRKGNNAYQLPYKVKCVSIAIPGMRV